jgi:hypothetical protein
LANLQIARAVFKPVATLDSRGRRVLLVAISAIVILGWIVMLPRVPTFWPDAELYASIALGQELHGSGIPTMAVHSPLATDHIRFYGPVFFSVAGKAFDIFGVSKWSFRLVSLAGALLFAAAGVWLSRELNGPGIRWRWSLLLILLAPELGLHARTGSIDTTAIALELTSLTIFVRGLIRGTNPLGHGAMAGLALVLAALTTPRTYPFVAALVAAGALAVAMAPARRGCTAQLAATVSVFVAIFGLWATASHGNPIAWMRYVTYIGTHEDTDVAILPTATRLWTISPQVIITPIAAATGALIAARGLRIERRAASNEALAVCFALATGWIAFVTTTVLMDIALEVGAYVALPLFATVVGLPSGYFTLGRPRISKQVLAYATAALLCCGFTIKAVRYVRVASIWAAADPEPLAAFLAAHGTRGADVVGPPGIYFFVVEQSGGHYRSASPKSWADWARWVPDIEPQAVGPARRARAAAGRFLVWPADHELPLGYGCARSHLLGTYVPPPLGPFAKLGQIATGIDRGYPTTTLYSLPPGCPSGYDPTGRPSTAD